MTPDEYAQQVESWTLDLRAQRKSSETIRSYRAGARGFLAWCARSGVEPVLDRRTVNAYTAHLVEAGREGTTVHLRQLALRSLSAWRAEEGETDRDELLGIKPVKVDKKVVRPLSQQELAALIGVCKGKDFLDRRDEALVRFMSECFTRSTETVLHMTVSGTDLRNGRALVVKGKGGKERVVPFGVQTARALDRYLRVRRAHRLASSDKFWLGDRGRQFTYQGLYQALKRRAARAGVAKFHPHRLRHTGATRWLAAGGSEGGLMAVAGWSRREQLDRYVAATASERAAEEARKLGLGDL